jgi:hypothetical protein
VQAAGAWVHRDTMGGGNGGLVALRRAKKDGDTPFYRRAQGGGEADLRTKARESSPGRGMGSGGQQRRAAASWPKAERRCAGQRVKGERVALANVMYRSSRGDAWTDGR